MDEQQVQDLHQQLQDELDRETRTAEDEQMLQAELALDSSNLVDRQKKDELNKMADELLREIDEDINSRQEWEEKNQDFLKLAVQVVEKKSFPWPDASNVKYPLLTTATMQFQSRAYKTLVSGSRIVKARVIGEDKLGLKAARAQRISEHMSYQLLEQIPNWEDHMDTLCLVVPICGNAFKKTYFDGNETRSDLVLPQDLIVNFYATSLEQAWRKTHKIPLTWNDIISNVRSGYFSNIDLERLSDPQPDTLEGEDALKEGQGLNAPSTDDDAPYTFYECHTWWDLDEDDYYEPYIITICKQTQQVVRITPRFGPKDVTLNKDGEVVKINPIEIFTNYRFLPDPRSGVYGLGFGHILGPINEATNTLINQIIDSGTAAIVPSGWLGRGARMQTGAAPFKPGEWRTTNTLGDDIRKNIFPNPKIDPSPVMVQLLGMFIEAGQSLASVTDMMQGKSPGQNQPYSTTSAVLEQGMAVYSTIVKRMYRAFKEELKKIYRLNKLYLPDEVYYNIIDTETNAEAIKQITSNDYKLDTTDIVPNADPEQVTNFQKLADAELLFNLMQTGQINPTVAVKRILEARNITGIDELMTLPPPQPNPEIELKSRELDIQEKVAQMENQIEGYKATSQATRDQAASVAKLAEVKMAEANFHLEAIKQQYDQMMRKAELDLERHKVMVDQLKAEADTRNKNTIKASDIEKKAKDKKAKATE